MIEHLAWAFELSTGQAQTECPIPAAKREQLKAFLHDNRSTPRDFANPVHFKHAYHHLLQFGLVGC
jgi:hypothetical protein